MDESQACCRFHKVGANRTWRIWPMQAGRYGKRAHVPAMLEAIDHAPASGPRNDFYPSPLLALADEANDCKPHAHEHVVLSAVDKQLSEVLKPGGLASLA